MPIMIEIEREAHKSAGSQTEYFMALQAIITEEAFKGLSETLKNEYKKREDGKYLLDVAAVDGFSLEDTTGLSPFFFRGDL